MKKILSVVLSIIMVTSVIFVMPVNAVNTDVEEVGYSVPDEAGFLAKLNQLRAKYPNGGTWSGAYYENGTAKAWQCFGYANQMLYEVFGAQFYNDGFYNKKDYNMGTIYAGDWVRIVTYGEPNNHSIFITKVTNDRVYFTDANWNGKNGIRWDASYTKEELAQKFSYKVHIPGNTLTGNGVADTTPTLTSNLSGNRISSANDITFSWSTVTTNMSGYNLYVAKNIAGTVNYDWDNGRIYCPGLSTNMFTLDKGKLSAGSYAAFVQAININTNEKSPQSNFIYFVVEDDIISDINSPYDGITIDLSQTQTITVRGWAVNTGRYEVDCYATIDNEKEQVLSKVERIDVSNSSLYSYYCTNSWVGFQSQINVSQLTDGEHYLIIKAKSISANKTIARYIINIVNSTIVEPSKPVPTPTTTETKPTITETIATTPTVPTKSPITTNPTQTKPTVTSPITTNPTERKTTVTLTKYSAKLYVKGTTTIKPTVKNGKGITTYRSNNTRVAKVDSRGKVTALKSGTAKITVTNNKVSKVFTVNVLNPKLNKTSVSIGRGKSYTLKITGKIGTAKFYTSNKKIATVNSKGKIKVNKKAKKGKIVIIKVKTNGITLKCKVKVK